MPSGGRLASPDGGSTSPGMHYYVRDDSGRPIEALDATTLSGAVAEAKSMAVEDATEDACRFGETSGQCWLVYSRDRDGAYRLEDAGIEYADHEYVARIMPGSEVAAAVVEAAASAAWTDIGNGGGGENAACPPAPQPQSATWKSYAPQGAQHWR